MTSANPCPTLAAVDRHLVVCCSRCAVTCELCWACPVIGELNPTPAPDAPEKGADSPAGSRVRARLHVGYLLALCFQLQRRVAGAVIPRGGECLSKHRLTSVIGYRFGRPVRRPTKIEIKLDQIDKPRVSRMSCNRAPSVPCHVTDNATCPFRGIRTHADTPTDRQSAPHQPDDLTSGRFCTSCAMIEVHNFPDVRSCAATALEPRADLVPGGGLGVSRPSRNPFVAKVSSCR